MRTLFLLISLFVAAVPVVQALDLQGAAVYRRLNNDVYLAAVYSDNPDSQSWLVSSDPLRLDMVILAEDLSPRRFYRLWNEGLAINLSEGEMNARVAQVTEFMHLLDGDLVAGDQVKITNETGATEVSINGVVLLTLDDPTFPRALLTAWIGRYPRSQSFKNELMSMDGTDRIGKQAELAAMLPGPGREAVIRSWVEAEEQAQAVAEEEAAVIAAAEAAEAEAAEPGLEGEPMDEPGMDVVEDNQAVSVEEQEALRLAAEKAAAELAAREAERQRRQQLLIAQQRAETTYYRDLLRTANSNVVYPRQALRRNLQGVSRVIVTIDRSGNLLSAHIAESSGHSPLDRAATQAADRAAPFSPIPDILEGDQFEFDIPFRFVMNNR